MQMYNTGTCLVVFGACAFGASTGISPRQICIRGMCDEELNTVALARPVPGPLSEALVLRGKDNWRGRACLRSEVRQVNPQHHLKV